MELKGKFDTAEEALTFMLGGNATVTVRSLESGKRFTFKIQAPVDRETGKRQDPSDPATPLFVKVMTGPDNESSYEYLGMIRNGAFTTTRATRNPGAPSVNAFAFTYAMLGNGAIDPAFEVWHEGSCGRCGRKLTVPASVASGFGPECIKVVIPDVMPAPRRGSVMAAAMALAA